MKFLYRWYELSWDIVEMMKRTDRLNSPFRRVNYRVEVPNPDTEIEVS